MKLDHICSVQGTQVHIKHPYKDKSLCGQLIMQVEKHGIKMQNAWPTPVAANCKACGKGVEMLCREQLSKLTTTGLEKILDTIASMQNGELKPYAKGSSKP